MKIPVISENMRQLKKLSNGIRFVRMQFFNINYLHIHMDRCAAEENQGGKYEESPFRKKKETNEKWSTNNRCPMHAILLK